MALPYKPKKLDQLLGGSLPAACGFGTASCLTTTIFSIIGGYALAAVITALLTVGFITGAILLAIPVWGHDPLTEVSRRTRITLTLVFAAVGGVATPLLMVLLL